MIQGRRVPVAVPTLLGGLAALAITVGGFSLVRPALVGAMGLAPRSGRSSLAGNPVLRPTSTGQAAEPGRQPVSRSIRAAAYAVPLCVLPSALWRLWALADGLPPGCRQATQAWEPYYITGLSVVSFGAALLPGCPSPLDGPGAWVAVASDAPLLAWGPLLVVVTVAYYRRRTHTTTAPSRTDRSSKLQAAR
jgi:hypothetical protein